jgi:PRTRC genetic system ThiF family protein
MKQPLKTVHVVDNYLINPTNPVLVNLIGAGGTGSQVLSALARISHSLVALNHPGIFARVFDDDTVTEPNLGRQLFSAAELGLNKGVALINRINRFFGTNWKAIPKRYTKKYACDQPEYASANITISCVDTVAVRFEIADILKVVSAKQETGRDKLLYWMDFGNNQFTGQVVLSTVQPVKQPTSRKFKTIDELPFITDEFKNLLESAEENNTPSCSLAEALTKQDLFINSSLASMGASLLWSMFREGMLTNRGFFINLKDFRALPLKII